ncbi:MAG: hypothetical protein MJA27_13330 [Pseudanabaenales cyanobacterium]|nr:hypothetical protein [Pseudanabaenales cyanobacterium]
MGLFRAIAAVLSGKVEAPNAGRFYAGSLSASRPSHRQSHQQTLAMAGSDSPKCDRS